jgi:Carboxypeptidase regulatory-like domain
VSGADNGTSATGKISGRVVGAEGEPAATALVELLELGLRTYTNRDGVFEIADVPLGAYTIRVIATGFRIQRQEVEVNQSVTCAEFRLLVV